MCSETSPRLSFSNDISQEDHDSQNEAEARRDSTLLDSSSYEFEFSICSSSINDESSLADDLFSDGMILPVQVIRETPTQNHVHKHIPKVSLPPLPCPSSTGNSKKEITKEIVSVSSDLAEKTHQSKSFWGFKRSSSLNCDIKKSLICSLPLLSRSNSTGSVPNSKRSSSLKDVLNKQSSQKQHHSSSAKSSASSYYVYSLPHKPPLKKSYGASFNSTNVVRISPVLNVPPPYIPKGTANLFGLGSFLRNGKEKKNKKMMVQ